MTAIRPSVPSVLLAPPELGRWERRRAWRVILLTIAIAAMSLVDLYITMLYVRSVGMSEANPLARIIMTHFPPGTIVVWKLVSIALACAIFLTARRTRSAEVGAWVCCLVLLWLSVRWMAYSDEVATLTPTLHLLSQQECAKWVHVPR